MGINSIYRAAGLESSLPGLPSSSSSSTFLHGRFNLSGVEFVFVVDGLAQQALLGVLRVARDISRRRCASQETISARLPFPSSRPSSSSSTRSGRFNLRGVESVLVVDGFVQQASPGVICVIRNVYRRRCATQETLTARYLLLHPGLPPLPRHPRLFLGVNM